MVAATRLRIKRIYEPASPNDGARVLIDRVWPRGISKDAADLSSWLKDVAPSTKLRKWFGHAPVRWTEFRRRYHRELDANGAAIENLRNLLRKRRVTLLYGARDEKHNHAVALADYIRRHQGRRGGHRSA